MGFRGEVHIADVVIELEQNNLLPAIVFRTSRSQCDADVQAAATSKAVRLAPPEQYAVRKAIADIVERYEMDPDIILTHPQYMPLVLTGVGAHHAGQLLMWRLLLEELMASGVLRVLVATGTVAAGVDFPARTVVVTAHSRRGSQGFAALTSAEFQQMSGRAGRRGKDTVGFCLAAPAPFCDARMILKISRRPPEPLRSAYYPGPSTVLNLLRYRNVDDLRFTVERSFAAFIDRKEARRYEIEADDFARQLPEEIRQYGKLGAPTEDDAPLLPADVQIPREQRRSLKRIRRLRRQGKELERRQVQMLELALNGLRELHYVEGNVLSPKGFWAANLCTSLVLILGEIIEGGFLNGLSAEHLAALVGSLSGDEHRQYLGLKKSVLEDDVAERLNEIVERVDALEVPGGAGNCRILPAAADTVYQWMHAKDWHEFRSILLLQGVAEGDAARLITQTAEQLNQITRLAQSHPELVLRAEEAKRRILRPPLTEVMNLES